MTDSISNSEDIIDSRDVIARIEELEALLPKDARDVMPGTSHELQAIREELATLQALAKQGEGYSEDWEYGSTLIRETYFVTYAEELAEDIGAIDRDASWPLSFIDWDAAAVALKQDYTEVDFDGVAYLVR